MTKDRDDCDNRVINPLWGTVASPVSPQSVGTLDLRPPSLPLFQCLGPESQGLSRLCGRVLVPGPGIGGTRPVTNT